MAPVDDPLDALAGLPTIAHPTAAPDGDAVALYYDDTGRNEAHVIDVATGEREQWSDGEVPRNARWHLAWGPHGDRLCYHRDEGGNEQNDVWALDRDGTAEPLVEQDGQLVIYDVSEAADALLLGGNRDGQLNLYRHDLTSGETAKLTDYERAIFAGEFSPDGTQIAYTTNETDDFDNRDTYVAAADGGDLRRLDVGETGAETIPVDWGPDGDRLLLADNSTDLGRIGIYDLEGDTVRWLGDGAYEEEPEAIMSGGSQVVGRRLRGPEAVPIVYDLESGDAREFDLPAGVAEFGLQTEAVLDDERVILTHTTPTSRKELLVYDLGNDEREVLLPADHGPYEPSDFADATYIEVPSDGVPDTRQAAVEHELAEELDIGALLYDPGTKPAPLVVNPHGGPRARDEAAFDLYTQVLAARGFAVLHVNYRGSAGRGREFVERLIGDWGGAEQGDVATAAEHVLETRDWLDEDRVAVFGGSYGGYSAYWQLVQYPDLYDAGVAWIGLTDLEDMYQNTMPHYRVELMEKYLGTPAENPELYEKRSPITHVENLAAPLLMLHGVNDSRVPVSQARLFREELRKAGFVFGEEGDVEYVELGEEGHASTDQAQKLRMFRQLDAFLTRRLGVASDD